VRTAEESRGQEYLSSQWTKTRLIGFSWWFLVWEGFTNEIYQEICSVAGTDGDSYCRCVAFCTDIIGRKVNPQEHGDKYCGRPEACVDAEQDAPQSTG
jgi:hypothetical protein